MPRDGPMVHRTVQSNLGKEPTLTVDDIAGLA